MRICICKNSVSAVVARTLLLAFITGNAIAAEITQYPAIVKALQQRYADEIIAHQKYSMYAQQAEKEDYSNIAHLFRSLAASEAVHARNFKRLILKLGHEPMVPTIPEFPVTTTKQNIRDASSVEANEIDREYPAILESIQSENHGEAIQNITYAWEAERQHRDLILKIKKASKRFFGLLAGHIEGIPARYHVCQICGSTLTELPPGQCPICGHTATRYTEVPGFPGYPEEEDEY
jgi:rubrerythrin